MKAKRCKTNSNTEPCEQVHGSTGVITFEQVYNLTRKLVSRYVFFPLWGKNISEQSGPWFTFEVSQNHERHFFIEMSARYGPFGEGKHTTRCKYLAMEFITPDDIVNQIFHTLTWDHSPYYWNAHEFKKKIEVAG